MKRGWMALLALLVLGCGPLLAEEILDPALVKQAEAMQQQMLAMEKELEQVEGTATSFDANSQSLISLQGRGKVQIGGDVNMDLLVKRRSDRTSRSDVVDSTEFATHSANLRFKVDTTDSTYLYIKLDLDDFAEDDRLDGLADSDDLLEEIKFVWQGVRGSCWNLMIGKGEAPYGQDRTLGIIQSYHHNDGTDSSEGPVFLVNQTETASGVSQGNPHANVGSVRHPGETDNVYQIQASRVIEDWLKLEFALFQNNETVGATATTPARGAHEDRSDDTMFFESWAARVWWLPDPEWTVVGSLMRQHVDSFGDTKINGPNAVDHRYALSLGFTRVDMETGNTFFGEYQHGWNYNYSQDYSVDIFQLGMTHCVGHQVTWGLMGEWMAIDNDLTTGREDYYKVVTNLRFDWHTDWYFLLEYGYEFYEGLNTTQDDYRDAHLVGARLGWSF